MECYLSM